MCPGPSARAEDAARIHEAGIPLGAVSCAYQLAPFAAFVAASDAAWWKAYPDALEMDCPRYSMHRVKGAEQVRIRGLNWTVCNSGVLGLEMAKRQGATEILLMGADMHGAHFFGEYTNGLRNTVAAKRKQHVKQYHRWGKASKVRVINVTPGSVLTCFEVGRLEGFL